MVVLSPAEARRIAVRAQRLDAVRPADALEVLDALQVVALDPVSPIAPCADHVLWSRIGEAYEPSDLRRLLETERLAFEWGGFVRPMSDLPLVRHTMRSWPPYAKHRDWLAANQRFRDDVLARLAAEGELRTGEIPDTSQERWPSTGWTNDRNVSQLLELLAMQGRVAVSRRAGREKVWDLAERVYPELPELPAQEAARSRDEGRLRALGIARAKSVAQPHEPIDVGAIGEPATVDGVPGEWRVDPEALAGAAEPNRPRVALLSPHDRLVFDRTRLEELFGFEYLLEMYKPAAKRRWGYFALPVLAGDELVGKLDAKADRKAGLLRVHALHEDRPLDGDTREAIDAEIEALAHWLGLELARR